MPQLESLSEDDPSKEPLIDEQAANSAPKVPMLLGHVAHVDRASANSVSEVLTHSTYAALPFRSVMLLGHAKTARTRDTCAHPGVMDHDRACARACAQVYAGVVAEKKLDSNPLRPFRAGGTRARPLQFHPAV